jgi:hypothetical protein
MNTPTIESLLKNRGAWPKAVHGDKDAARANAPLTRLIADNYALFEDVRDHILRETDDYTHRRVSERLPLPEGGQKIFDSLIAHKIIVPKPGDIYVADSGGRRYLSGGWLEELAWLAAMESGADEANFGQVLGWEVKGFHGENEIDLIIRRNDHLTFVSCKALSSEMDMADRKLRHRLMDAVHEADNLVDHFGEQGERVAVLVTTDLFDEMKNVPRYNALMGKAAVLDVQVIALEDIGWDRLVKAIGELHSPKEA